MNGFELEGDRLWRYSRQIILKKVGSHGQKKLMDSKVLVIGAGGLGSPVLYYLAGAGIGTIGIADFDTITLSNLNRQILHTTDDIGKKKVDSAEEKLKRLNPDINIIKYSTRINSENIEEIVSYYDLVIDATDNFPARYLISDCCYILNKPLIEGAVVEFYGNIITIIPGKTPCYRCLYPDPPEDGVVPTCSDQGILGAVTGIVGSMQALEAIKVLLEIGNTVSGRFLSFDGLEMEFEEVHLEKKHSCPLCGDSPTINELVEYELKCKTKGL